MAQQTFFMIIFKIQSSLTRVFNHETKMRIMQVNMMYKRELLITDVCVVSIVLHVSNLFRSEWHKFTCLLQPDLYLKSYYHFYHCLLP
jgi:hypothetical protein